MILTRAEAWELRRLALDRPVRFDLDPVEAGLGGCPWRVAVAHLVGRGLSFVAESASLREGSRRVVRDVLLWWPAPGDLELAGVRLEEALAPVRGTHLRTRSLRLFSAAWQADDWHTLLDLPLTGRRLIEAIDRHCRQGRVG